MFKVVGVCGSLREGGNTETAVREVLSRCEARGASTELITLFGKKISDCHNCGVCKKGPCPIEDDVPAIIGTLETADIIVFASPVYFGDVSGVLKSLMDRTVEVKRRGSRFRNKIACAIAVGGVWGHSRALETIAHFACGHSMNLLSVDVQPGIGIKLTAGVAGELAESPDELKKLDSLVDRIFEVVPALRQLRSSGPCISQDRVAGEREE